MFPVRVLVHMASPPLTLRDASDMLCRLGHAGRTDHCACARSLYEDLDIERPGQWRLAHDPGPSARSRGQVRPAPIGDTRRVDVMIDQSGDRAENRGERQPRKRLTGFRAFLVVWLGQVLSMTGSSMSQFALSIWAYQKTGLATSLAMVEFFFQGAMIAATPLAGVYVDRWNRKLTMMLSDLLAVCGTIAILILYHAGQLAIWHLCVVGVVNGVGQAFQFPAYSAAITQMVPKEHYARAGGLMSLAESGSVILAPIFAGLLIGIIKVGGILTIDIVTFGFAFGALLLIDVPSPGPRSRSSASPCGDR